MRMIRWTSLVLAAMLVGCPGDDEGPQAVEESTGSAQTSSGATGEASASGTGAATTTMDTATTSATDAQTTGLEGGCGVDPGFSGAVSGAVTAQDLERTYLLVLPDGYDPSRAYPLVYMLHGRSSNGEQFRGYAGVEEAAGGEAIFAYPDALPLESMGGQTGWELGAGDRDVAFFDVLHEELTANLCIDSERVFAAGHSFGGFFSNTLGCVRGDVLRAIGPVAGGGPGGACTGRVAAWVAHGEGDEIVDAFLGEMSRRHWRDANGCATETEPVDPAPCETHQGCDEGYPVTWCLHMEDNQGIGTHGWPSFAPEAIWAFFAAF